MIEMDKKKFDINPESRIIATNNSVAPLRVFPKTSCLAL